MFRQSVRRFATTTARRAVAPAAAHEPSPHTLAVSKAQGIAKGLTGGMLDFYLPDAEYFCRFLSYS